MNHLVSKYMEEIDPEDDSLVSSKALEKVQENIFQGHLESCVKDSLEGEDPKDRAEKVSEILEILAKFR